MSRKEVISDNRCPVCGGKMKLVNVTHTNTFRTPEASQYDQCISNRKAMLGNLPESSSMEMMCSNCCRRSPVEEGKGKKKVKGSNKKLIKTIIDWVLFFALIAVIAYFEYKYRETIVGWINKVGEFFNNIKEFFGNLF